MAHALGELTEKEKETLRLIVRGHDAKSMAAEFDLSVHTINCRPIVCDGGSGQRRGNRRGCAGVVGTDRLR